MSRSRPMSSRSTQRSDGRAWIFRRVIALASLGGSALIASAVIGGGGGGGKGGQITLPTTGEDFFMPGTQPETNPLLFEPVQSSINCTFCHSGYSIDVAPYDSWVVSLKGQAARDPVFHAALTIANQDSSFAGEFCIRCHAPGAWLRGVSTAGDLSEFVLDDFDGVNCHFCHRAVNPELGPHSAVGYPPSELEPNPDPTPDVEVLEALAAQGLMPISHGNAQFIVDPRDVRRGPLDDVPDNLHGLNGLGEPVSLIFSPFHLKSEFCGQCHDVSTPTYTRQPDGTYALNDVDTPHPTQDLRDMYPEQRTYSEWQKSEFATDGVFFPDGRFGGDHPTGIMSSCQDCHMPLFEGGACFFYTDPPYFSRKVPQHSFSGSNTWVIGAVAELAGEEAEFLGLTPDRVDAARARVVQMLRNASDMEVAQKGEEIAIRVTNYSGHKLPTGYPEGRRMWLNVKFFNEANRLVGEHGAYDFKTSTLNRKDTKVYEAEHGIDGATAKATGLPRGKSFHLALNNKILFDNRIPPIGFDNAEFESVQAAPVGYAYADGQHWDDTIFTIPPGATKVVVTLYYQTSSREYMEFLRDANVTNGLGQVAYDAWVSQGKSAPVDMDTAMLVLTQPNPADLNNDGVVDGADLGQLLSAWGRCRGCPEDLDGNGVVDAADLGTLLSSWG